VSGVIEAIRVIFGREKIQDLPARHIDPFRLGLLGWLFGREELPQDEPPLRPSKPALLTWLFAPEDLPYEEPRPPVKAGSPPFLQTLFAREELPRDGEGGAAGGDAGTTGKKG